MKATLTFDLDIQEDQLHHELAIIGTQSHLSLWCMWSWLFSKQKDEDEDHPYSVALSQLLFIMEEHGVPLEPYNEPR